MIERLRYGLRRRLLRPRRYRNVLAGIHDARARSILEVGVFNGVHARQMIETAAIFHPVREIEYHGFDLFEQLTPELLAKELSKQPPTEAAVRRRLEATGARIHLHAGYSQETLPRYLATAPPPPDFAFIDGGHSLATIESDWGNVSRLVGPGTTVFFDDYYYDAGSEIAATGCRPLIDALDRACYDVAVLEPIDEFAKPWGTLRISMVRVRLRRP
ncbi:MAG TPA: class I SAM-dependent methyltransferase [Candidatus Methanoperedens sp.]|nr:class I SAM-dependent methyltransferase [Candidatus Methanoperedens sp.]